MIKVAIYARYSSDNQREESIEAQVRAITEFATQNDFTIVKTYIDEALSAKTDNRPQFLQMIADSKKGLFNAIICHKLDRFARNRYDSAFYKKALKDYGVKLISVLENFDDSPESIILESVLEGMAEYYSANLAREVMKGLKENALKCRHTGGKPPFGYDVISKEYIINKNEAKAIEQIFYMINSGQSVGKIIEWLENNSYKTKYGTKFSTSSLNAIIRNEKYKGVYVYGKNKRTKIDGTFKDVPGDDVVRIQDGIPRIVDNETWDKANSIYNERQYKSGGQAKAKEIYLLSGLIYCGLCGGSMCGSKVNSGRSKIPRITYKCNTRKAKKTCNAKDIRRDVIENIVIEELENALSDDGIDEFIDAVLRQAIEMTSEIPVEIKALKSKLKTIDSQIEPMVNAIMDGLYSPSIKEKLSLMEMEKHDYIEKIEFLENRSNSMIKLDNARIKNYLKKDMDIKSKNMDEKKRIIQAHIKKILVFPDHVDIIREVDTNSGAEPYIVVSTYEYKQPINLKPLFIKKKSKIVNNA